MTARIPSTDVHEHLSRLLLAGLTVAEVGHRAGLSRQAVEYVRTHPTVTPRIAQAILNVSGPTHFGARRRIAALLAIGWTTRQIDRQAGLHRGAAASIMTGRRRATDATLPGLVRAYQAMWRGPEHPNPITLRHARKCGYAPPMAWDDDSIDDPAAVPCGLEDERPLSTRDQVLELLDLGVGVTEIPGRIGKDWKQVLHSIRDKALRDDLRARAIAAGMVQPPAIVTAPRRRRDAA